MSDTRDWADDAAREIVHSCNTKGMTLAQLTEFGTTIAQALRAARRVPDGHIREGDVDRKVLGTLLVTADGCVVGWGDFGMWYLRGNSREVVGPLLVKNDASGFSGCQQHHSPSDCYSTRAAAEAASKRAGESL